jgi:glycosyltransferase involved in cell wall biosynthesis
MHKELDISVVMSVYNGEAYLREAIESILTQTHHDYEFIIINDGSTDNSERIISAFKDPRIVSLKNEKNIGLIASLNRGLVQAKGKYIARIDADDVAIKDRLEKQFIFMEEHPGVVALGSDYYLLINETLRYIKNEGDSDYLKSLLLFTPCFCHPTVMMRNIFSRSGIVYDANFVHAEDYKLWTELAFLGKFGNVPQPLLKYRSHQSQVSNKNAGTQLQISAEIRKEYLRKLGFSCSESQLKIHNLIGNNVFIRTSQELDSIEKWLLELIAQNSTLLVLDPSSFKNAMHKFWLDSCGNTRLGLRAYTLYFRSKLSEVRKISPKESLFFRAKCLLRRFKR